MDILTQHALGKPNRINGTYDIIHNNVPIYRYIYTQSHIHTQSNVKPVDYAQRHHKNVLCGTIHNLGDRNFTQPG